MGNIVASFQTTAEQAVAENELEGKVIVVTGGTSGLGLESVRVLATAGAKVVVGARRLEEAEKVVKRIRSEAGCPVEISLLPLDLASLRSIHSFVDCFLAKFDRLDCLVLNAAVMQTPCWMTREGFEYQFGVNFLGHVELAKGLLEKRMLGQTFKSRLVVVTCKMPLQNVSALTQLRHWQDVNFTNRPYSAACAFAQSKVALAVWASDLSRRVSQTSVGVFIVHPGVALTRIYRWLPIFNMLSLGLFTLAGFFVKSIEQAKLGWAGFVPMASALQAASTIVYCCSKPQLWDTGHGQFFENCRPARAPAIIFDQTFGEQVWRKSDEMLQGAVLDSHEPIDYNVGRVVLTRIWQLFVRPFLERLGLLGILRAEKTP